MLRILTKTETQPIARSVPEKAAAGSVRTGWSRRCATSQVGPGSGKHHHGPMAPWPHGEPRVIRVPLAKILAKVGQAQCLVLKCRRSSHTSVLMAIPGLYCWISWVQDHVRSRTEWDILGLVSSDSSFFLRVHW